MNNDMFGDWLNSLGDEDLERILAEIFDGWEHQDFELDAEEIQRLENEIRKRKLKKLSW